MGIGGRSGGRLLPLMAANAVLDALELLHLPVYLIGEALLTEADDVEDEHDDEEEQDGRRPPRQHQLAPRVSRVTGAQHVVDLHLLVTE